MPYCDRFPTSKAKLIQLGLCILPMLVIVSEDALDLISHFTYVTKA
jgi:hypothetical protein